MTARTTRRTFTLGAVATTAGALALALLPASVAHAGPTAPVFSYLSSAGVGGNKVPYVNVATGDPVALPPTATALTATSGVQTYAYDVSNDGKSWAGCMATGPVTANDYDRTYALVLTHSEGPLVVSKIISNFCEGNPVLSADGASLWWFSGDKIAKFSATYDGSTAAISGSTTVVSTGQFVIARTPALDAIEYVEGLAVSPDGVNAAVMFADRSGMGTVSRVRAAALSTAAPKPAYFEAKYNSVSATASAPVPRPDTFVFTLNGTVLYNVVDSKAAAPQPSTAWTADIPAGVTTTVPTPATALDGTYGVRPYLDPATPGVTTPTWYVWRDVYSGVTFDHTEYATTVDVTAALTGWTARTDGDKTSSYVPSTASPAPMSVVGVPAPAHASFTVLASAVSYGKRASFTSRYNLYDINPLSGSYAASAAAEVDKGKLEWSSDGGRTWASKTTSGAEAYPSGGRWIFGNSPTVLTRNTYFRWTYQGSLFTAAAPSITRLVRVVPTVKVAVTKYANGSRRIYGAATRKYGAAQLWRYSKGAWRKVTTIGINPVGAFNFGTKKWPRGKYRVITLADAGWAAGAVQFAF